MAEAVQGATFRYEQPEQKSLEYKDRLDLLVVGRCSRAPRSCPRILGFLPTLEE
jgi:hypothetical protein